MTKISRIQVSLLLSLGLSLSSMCYLQAADGSGEAKPLSVKERQALLAQKQAEDKNKGAKPTPQPRRVVTKPAPVLESKSPETVAASAAPAPAVASPAPVTGGVKARAAALATKVQAAGGGGGAVVPGKKLATCTGAGRAQCDYEALKEQAAAEQAAAQAEPVQPRPEAPNPLALAAAEAGRAKHGGAEVAAIPDLTPEQLAGKTVVEREAERLAAEAIEKAEVKKLADLAATEAVRLEQERVARLAAEEALRVEQARLAAEQERVRLAELEARRAQEQAAVAAAQQTGTGGRVSPRQDIAGGWAPRRGSKGEDVGGIELQRRRPRAGDLGNELELPAVPATVPAEDNSWTAWAKQRVAKLARHYAPSVDEYGEL